jgi:hypothetical protein
MSGLQSWVFNFCKKNSVSYGLESLFSEFHFCRKSIDKNGGKKRRERNYLVEINVGWVWHFYPGKWPVSGQVIENQPAYNGF